MVHLSETRRLGSWHMISLFNNSNEKRKSRQGTFHPASFANRLIKPFPLLGATKRRNMPSGEPQRDFRSEKLSTCGQSGTRKAELILDNATAGRSAKPMRDPVYNSVTKITIIII